MDTNLLNSTIESLNFTIRSCESLLNKEEVITENCRRNEKELKEKEAYLKFIKGAKEKYTIAINELYEESIASLKDTLNIALKYIIFDKNYRNLKLWIKR